MKTNKTALDHECMAFRINTRVAHAGSLPLEGEFLNMQYCS